MAWFIGVDVGGTFTDLFVFNRASGRIIVHKTPSTPDDPSRAILRGLEELAELQQVDLKETERFSHGTTVATNALLQRRGGRVALITTRGFKDLIEIGRQIRPKIYSLQDDQADHVVPRADRLEADERILFDGAVHHPLSEKEIVRLVDAVRARDPEACAICFLFSFINREHEAVLAERLRAALPNIYVSASSEVQPEFREYERLSTTVVNAYLQPVMHRYLSELRDALDVQIPKAQIGVNQSSGGLMSLDRAIRFPVRTALSGPAAGAMGAVHVASSAGHPDVVTLDMGGTSADICLIRKAEVGRAFEREINGLPLRMPVVDIHTIGAGGGSVAWFDKDGLLKVGPASAGARPGPACYGHGGTLPTVSDANAVLGRLGGSGLLGGSMALDVGAARQAIAPLAERLGVSIEDVAHGIIEIVNSNMVRAIRVVSVEKGHDPRDLTLMPFGGAGPLHSSGVARLLGIRRILVPLLPGILCAQGLIVSDLKEEFVRTLHAPLDPPGLEALIAAVDELKVLSASWFDEEEITEPARIVSLSADLRYAGQNYELSVLFELAGRKEELETRLTGAFYKAHELQYGFFSDGAPIQIVNVRLIAVGVLRKPQAQPADELAHGKAVPQTHREVFYARQSVRTPVYDRGHLCPGQTIRGPAIIEQMDATTVLMPGDMAMVDPYSNIVIEASNGE